MKRIPVIEALRAVASLSVALFHICNQFHTMVAMLIARYAWLGVDVFFVISGFVVPLSLYGRAYHVTDFPGFLLRRLVRLEPAYVVSIVLIVALQYASYLTPSFAGAPPNFQFAQIAFHLFYLIPLTNYQWISPVYWSLAYEFVFYTTVGLCFSFLIKRGVLSTVLLASIAVSLSFYFYETIDVRIIEFLIGTLLMRSTVDKGGHSQIQIWLVICGLLVFYFGGLATGIAISLAVFAILFLQSKPFGKWTLFLGSISYSLYLIHVPIGGRVVNLAKRFGEGQFYDLLIAVAALLSCLLVAALMYRFVEVPSLRASRRIGRQPGPQD